MKVKCRVQIFQKNLQLFQIKFDFLPYNVIKFKDKIFVVLVSESNKKKKKKQIYDIIFIIRKYCTNSSLDFLYRVIFKYVLYFPLIDELIQILILNS